MRPGLFLPLALLGLAPLAPAADGVPTYHGEISRIIQTRCQDCHRPGQVAPFSLLTYEQARKRAGDIAGVASDRSMPPWHASTREGGPFRDVRVMPQDEIDALAAWASAGAPEGDPTDAPPHREFPSDWPLGEPDLVLKPSAAYTLAADGPDEFRVFVLPSGLTEGKWIQGIDYRPGNLRVVHHVLAAFDTRGRARKLDEADPTPGYSVSGGGYRIFPEGELDGWAPGKSPHRLADGVARYLPAGSDVLLQVHYHKSGKPEEDATAIGLYFAKAPVEKQLRAGGVLPPFRPLTFKPDLTIPAGADRHEVRGSMTLRSDIHVVAVIPHMHWLGRDFLLTAALPDGSKTTLIRIDHWDFNWQSTYDLAAPLPLPKGTRLEMLAHFDNSESNPSNPTSPPKEVRWGEQTTDEMCIGFIHYTRDDEHLTGGPPARKYDPLADWWP
ncbi:monooxygenase [Paludisphaera rhizosphaerae]|uniref:monooxygenase n=1 Tax=Paludisphaera rhizosphaerae TaxID=2711216 RepID=UPI0013ECCDC0|nr:ascorbate-dependent monooxygenase [Paludisphaera rhizosphaerae]